MSQYSLVIEDGTGSEVLTALTEAFNAVATLNSGSAAPAETYAFMWWADTTTGMLKLRNAANTDWIEVGTLADANLGLLTGDSIGSTVQAHDADLDALSASGAGAQIASYGVNGIGFRNRIINGAMMIDQRNAGASVTPTSGQYTVDRWLAGVDQSGKFSVQQSSTAPVGFVTSMLCTSLSAYSVLSTDAFQMRQNIEGLNVSDLAWGTANAATVTLSFWVRSSLTGTFGGSIVNNAYDRSYPFSYTISAANTWEQKSVTIAGDTSGTWLTTNGVGIRVGFGLGAGSSKSTTAGAWASGFYGQPTGATSVVGTNGATFYITGVQLEKGSTATGFDYRPYGTELALCQRYYERSYDVGIATGTIDEITADWGLSSTDTSLFLAGNKFKVTKRSAPTMVFYNTTTGASGSFVAGNTTMTVGSYSGGTASCARLYATVGIGSAGVYSRWHWTASSEL